VEELKGGVSTGMDSANNESFILLDGISWCTPKEQRPRRAAVHAQQNDETAPKVMENGRRSTDEDIPRIAFWIATIGS